MNQTTQPTPPRTTEQPGAVKADSIFRPVCHCGDYMDTHGVGSGHSPVEMPTDCQPPDSSELDVKALGGITIRLPREQILSLLSAAVGEHAGLADLLKFNVEHEQWDLIRMHLGTMAKHKTVIETCADALLRAASVTVTDSAQEAGK